ncbi:hypothetical protein [Nesterenkonia rhizosphaerae]|uniref:Uncharacterized protein n=1 Tax=Nesterenkonia rhizosphaerae TaxID=1348272 RepID=A0ABP9G0E9_9MICC
MTLEYENARPLVDPDQVIASVQHLVATVRDLEAENERLQRRCKLYEDQELGVASECCDATFFPPRVVTVDELREGQLICIHRGLGWGLRAIGTFVKREGDVVTIKAGGSGTFSENVKNHTLVLLADVPEPQRHAEADDQVSTAEQRTRAKTNT